MIKLKNTLLICFLIGMALTSCHQTGKFTTVKWKEGDGLQFPLRDEIVDDLVQTHQLKGMTYKQVQHLLSYPDGRDSVSFYYQIIETYNNMGKHAHVKNLVFYMGKDSIITSYKIYDKRFKK